MFYIDWAILMLDQNFWHIQIFHIHSAIQRKNHSKRHHLPTHTHTQTQTSYPTHHKRVIQLWSACTMTCSSRLSDHLIVPHNVHHTSVECFFLIPEVDCNNHKQMNTMIHQWSIPILISYSYIYELEICIGCVCICNWQSVSQNMIHLIWYPITMTNDN